MRRRPWRRGMPAPWKAEQVRQSRAREARAVQRFSLIMLATIVAWILGLSWIVFHII